jgi:phage terminase large subunit-like protein
MSGELSSPLPDLESFTIPSVGHQYDFSEPSSELTRRERKLREQLGVEAVNIINRKAVVQPPITTDISQEPSPQNLLDPTTESRPAQLIPPAQWIEDHFYDPTTVVQFGRNWDYTNAKKIVLSQDQKDILKVTLTPDENGQFPYSTVVYSTIKKEGKTTLASAVVSWMTDQLEPPNLFLCMANNQEQSAGRIFGNALPTLYALGCRVPLNPTSKPEVRHPNGTLLQAIPNNYAGQAGANYGGTFWSELWAYKTESSRRLYDELVPVPTRKNSIRWVETYAGFEDESELLLKLFLRIFVSTEEEDTQPQASPVPGLEHIQTEVNGELRPACWHIPEEGLFVYWNHTPRMPWNTGPEGEKFRRSQKADLRYSQYVRLWQNRWQSSEGTFIDPEWYDSSVNYQNEEWGPMVLAGDASQRHDTTALVGVQKRQVKVFGKDQFRYRVMLVRVFDPKDYHATPEMKMLGAKEHDLDLDETIAREVQQLHKSGFMIGPFWYDPWQLHQVAVNLRKLKVPCVEFPQGNERLKSDTFLWNLFKNSEVDCYTHSALESHVKAAKAKEYENEQIRLIKGTLTSSGRIDSCVALAMACWKASLFRPVENHRKTRGGTYM